MNTTMETAGNLRKEPSKAAGTILLVDDEANVLTALTRLFRPHGYRILSASSGQEGLNLIEREPVDLVISDMRMPNMSGAEFLSRVRLRDPSIFRILLTGYADMESTIEAINQGQIYQYINKPWEEHEILLIVQHAFEQKQLQKQKQELEQLTIQQNEELKELNANLDKQVLARTEELRQTVTFLELAQEQMQKGFMATVKTFSNLLELREKELAGHGRRVAEDARRIAQVLDFSDSSKRDIVFAGLLHDIGNLGLPTPLLKKSYAAMTLDERDEFAKHPQRGASVLMGLEQFQGAIPLIVSHHEYFDGSGFPKGLKADEIPLGARILCVINEFDSLLSGKLFNKKFDRAGALAYLKENKGTRYDPRIVDIFVSLKSQETEEAPSEKQDLQAVKKTLELRPVKLEPGMVLAKHLVTPGGFLIMPKGQQLTEFQIEHLIAMEKTEDIKLRVCVRQGNSDSD